MDILYIVMPAYNEEENICSTVHDWYEVVEQVNREENCRAYLVVINDGSMDHTGEMLETLAESRPAMKVLTKSNSGHGPTVLYGYRFALGEGADYIFQTDSDGQTCPGEFFRFWRRRKQYEAIFGNRIKRGDGADRALVEKVLCMLLKCIFGVDIPDANAPFRLMTADYVRDYLPEMPEDYNLPNVMLATFGVCDHRKVRFLPITFRGRQGGVNSVNWKNIIRTGWQALSDFRRIADAMKVRRGSA